MPPRARPPEGVYACPRPKLQAKLRGFLVAHADFPAEKVAEAVVDLDQWEAWCDQQGEVVAAIRVEQSDWYLCTLKNAAVRPDQRGKRLSSKIYMALTKRALQSPSCAVLAADVTFDNVKSIAALERAGFQKVNRYCWMPGEKPADILHYIRMPAKNDKC